MKRTLLRNGLLFTGEAERKARKADVLIGSNGLVEAISEQPFKVNGDTEIIDAEGKWITPGFLDTHTHYDAELIAAPGLNESARHGVTTVFMGSCSVSAIYNNAEDTSDSFTRVEAIPREIMLPLMQSEKDWDSPAGWKNRLKELPLGINVASFIGHSDMRMKVMGIERSLSEEHRASAAEQAEMCRLLEDALDEGFIGLSTMDNPWDKMDGDRYWSDKTPSYYADWKERRPLLDILRRRGAVLQGAPNLVTRINALQYMLVSTGWFRKPLKTTMIAMMDLIGDRYILPAIETASRMVNTLARGDFRMQSPPCPFTVYYDGVDSVMFEEFPSGEAMRHLAKQLDQRNELIRDPEFRKSFKAEIKRQFAPKVWHKDLSRSVVLECPDQSLVGKNFFEIAEEKKLHPVDAFLDLIIAYDKQIKWTTTIANDRIEQYHRIYDCPDNLISFSDAGAHLNNMAFYNFPLKMIRNVQDSIDAGKPIMTMEKCIWRLSKEQADWFGIDCGYLAEGKRADLVVIDPSKLDRVTEEVQSDTIEGFGGYKRLVNRNEGVVERVMVGGQTIFRNEEFVEGYGRNRRFGAFLGRQN